MIVFEHGSHTHPVRIVHCFFLAARVSSVEARLVMKDAGRAHLKRAKAGLYYIMSMWSGVETPALCVLRRGGICGAQG